MDTYATADKAYLTARDLLGLDGAALPFTLGAEHAKEQADRLIHAAEVLAFDASMDARVDVRDTTQDLLDVSELLARRVTLAASLFQRTDVVVARYATEYKEAVAAWRAAMSALIAVARPA